VVTKGVDLTVLVGCARVGTEESLDDTVGGGGRDVGRLSFFLGDRFDIFFSSKKKSFLNYLINLQRK